MRSVEELRRENAEKLARALAEQLAVVFVSGCSAPTTIDTESLEPASCVDLERTAAGRREAPPNVMRSRSDAPELFAQLALGARQSATPRL